MWIFTKTKDTSFYESACNLLFFLRGQEKMLLTPLLCIAHARTIYRHLMRVPAGRFGEKTADGHKA